MSLSSLIQTVKQAFPGKPHYTEKDVPDLTDKVVIVTGANTGIGKELSQILYARNARVYMLARSRDKTLAAIDDIRRNVPGSAGTLEYIHLDLADLTTIRTTADAFLAKEDSLQVLFNNAGVGFPEHGSTTKQGYELQLGVNCLGTLALTECLTPVLERTAAAASASKSSSKSSSSSVRVVFTSSSAAEASHPAKYMSTVRKFAQDPHAIPTFPSYAASKLGNYLHAAEYARRHSSPSSSPSSSSSSILAVSLNPGNLDSDLWRTQGAAFHWLLRTLFFYPVVNGAYTTLFAGFSPEVNDKTSGGFVAPWGRLWQTSPPLAKAATPVSQGGSGTAEEFYEWSLAQIRPYL
ncbi:uncharacterized protein B0I36DRAFT_366227 [Microdochium trichocladiopsis]|uniref:Short-chain dehydrogenase n=1 Tax=Microdochium trichocladiopsis TaxID=1682393 RepID=A0A9P9BMW8_9PEZI|nr:uncharacterized protein B0I36DRAFT_366227 [Microdochium trichocladiopsis]KAH7026698.1 hypothetical protein B0I36DRAFT_366227 [Microdochium trichocladiopsis]